MMTYGDFYACKHHGLGLLNLLILAGIEEVGMMVKVAIRDVAEGSVLVTIWMVFLFATVLMLRSCLDKYD
jgi:hypothetical protein